MNPKQEIMPQYIAVKVFGIISAVLMTLVGMLVMLIGWFWMSLAHEPEAWDMPNFTDESIFYLQMAGTAAIASGLICLFAALCGIGIAKRWRWTRAGSVVAHSIILLVVQSTLVYVLVQRLGALHGRDERIAAVVMVGFLIFLILYAVWALITLLGPWAGRYFNPKPFKAN